jgi:hypothetical protein
MPSTFTSNTGIELPDDGQQAGLWGQTVNLNMEILDRAINGSVVVSLSGTSHTLTTSDGVLSDGQYGVIVFGGSPSGTNTVTIAPDTAQKTYIVRNTTAQSVVLTQGSGGDVTIPAGNTRIVYTTGSGAGSAVVNITDLVALGAAARSLTLIAGDGLTGGGNLTADRTFTLGTPSSITATSINSVPGNSHTHAADATLARSARTITAGNGMTGGGDLTADRTLTMGTPGTLSASSTNATTTTSHTHSLDSTIARSAVTITAGNGMTGGGDLSANRTLTMGTPGTLDGTTTNAVTSTSHTHALSNQLSRLDAVSGSGLVVRNGMTSFLTRQLSGGSGINVSNGDGVATNPSIAVDSTVVRTSGAQTIDDTKTFVGNVRFNTSSATSSPGVGNTHTGSAFEGAEGVFSTSRASGSSARFNTNATGTLIDLRRQGTLVSTLTITASSTTLVDVSDQRRKTNIKPAEGDSGAVLDAIEIVEFDWLSGGHQQWGVVAQQVAEVAPDLVFVGGLPHAECTEEMLCEDDPAEKPWGWDPVGTIPMLIREVQLLRARVAALEEAADG